MLTLNDSKSETILFSKNVCNQCPEPRCDVCVGGIRISLINAVCILDVLMNATGTISTRV